MKILIKTSSNLYIYWNLGSLLMMTMIIQTILGFILTMNYFYYSNNMFVNSFQIFYNMNYGWMIRFFHSNMTSLIFIIMVIHIMRSIIYSNLINKMMWNSGIMMLLILMMISFMGYALINSQMAYWASIVITNFIMIIPLIGNKLMLLIWGNKFIDNLILNRFMALHFMLALSILMISMIHLMILHSNKSYNPLNLNNKIDQMNLNPTLMFKDMMMFTGLMYMFIIMNMIIPIKLNNNDNFNFAMVFKTLNNIEPEWYFLFFYSILRSNNNKTTGMMMMILSVLILLIIPSINKTKFLSSKYLLMKKINITMMIVSVILISLIGSKPAKEPFLSTIKLYIMVYFMSIVLMMIITLMINKI